MTTPAQRVPKAVRRPRFIPVKPFLAIRTGKRGRRAAYTVFCSYCKPPNAVHENVATTADFPETCPLRRIVKKATARRKGMRDRRRA